MRHPVPSLVLPLAFALPGWDAAAETAAACTLAYWHEPLFSSGPIGDISAMRPIWWALYDAGADVVLNGHDHLYERFAPQDPAGQADAGRGIRQFTVGTGGFHLFEAGAVKANSEVIIDDTYGVLNPTLHPTSYDWQFIGVDTDILDAGSGACH